MWSIDQFFFGSWLKSVVASPFKWLWFKVSLACYRATKLRITLEIKTSVNGLRIGQFACKTTTNGISHEKSWLQPGLYSATISVENTWKWMYATVKKCLGAPAQLTRSGSVLRGVRRVCSWRKQPFDRTDWMNDSVTKTMTCRTLLVVLVSFLKYHFSYLNPLIFIYSKQSI